MATYYGFRLPFVSCDMQFLGLLSFWICISLLLIACVCLTVKMYFPCCFNRAGRKHSQGLPLTWSENLCTTQSGSLGLYSRFWGACNFTISLHIYLLTAAKWFRRYKLHTKIKTPLCYGPLHEGIFRSWSVNFKFSYSRVLSVSAPTSVLLVYKTIEVLSCMLF